LLSVDGFQTRRWTKFDAGKQPVVVLAGGVSATKRSWLLLRTIAGRGFSALMNLIGGQFTLKRMTKDVVSF
jgi:hypothetical protein